ncbi:hypothetical protein D3C79_978270 [compost metagenome]
MADLKVCQWQQRRIIDSIVIVACANKGEWDNAFWHAVKLRVKHLHSVFNCTDIIELIHALTVIAALIDIQHAILIANVSGELVF